MALTSRVTLTGPVTEDPEDYLGTALGVIFPDDVMNQHGDADHGLLYESPHLPKQLNLSLCNPNGDEDRKLFSHYLWNSSLQLAELIETGTLKPSSSNAATSKLGPPLDSFDVTNLSTIELGAGTALPSLLSALVGANRVVITDYPAPAFLESLHANAARNVQPSFSPLDPAAVTPVAVEGHSWGDFDTPLAQGNKHAFDRVFVCHCLWMPWQHENLRRSVEWFLKEGAEARCWVVAGFHTGRESMSAFFRLEGLAAVGLELERIWERDCDGVEREWLWDRGVEDITVRKRWLALAVLRRRQDSDSGVPEAAAVNSG